MWMITPRGFYSAVQKRNDPPNMLTVRARAKQDLENLRDILPDIEIDERSGSDYPFRIRVLVSDWTKVCCALALEVDYPNFKDEVKKRQGQKRADVYMRIWSALLSLEPRSWARRWDEPLFHQTQTGRVLTDDDFERLADEAEKDHPERHRPAGTKTTPKTRKGRKRG